MRFETWVKLTQLSAVERALVRKVWRFQDAHTSGGVTVIHTDEPLRAVGATSWTADDTTGEAIDEEWVFEPDQDGSRRRGTLFITHYFPHAKLLAMRRPFGGITLFRFKPRPFTFAQAMRFGDIDGIRAAVLLDWALENNVHGAADVARKWHAYRGVQAAPLELY